MQIDDIAAWLGQVWDTDEGLARKATAGPWRHDPRKHWRKPGTAWFEEAVFAGPAGKDAVCVAGTGESDDPQSIYDAAFIAQHDPETMLARIAAGRQILDEYQWARKTCAALDTTRTMETGVVASVAQLNTLERVVRLLALPHADRPGYQESWRS